VRSEGSVQEKRQESNQREGMVTLTQRQGRFGRRLGVKWEAGEVLLGGRIWPFKGKE